MICGRSGVGEMELDPGVVDDARFVGPVWDGVSLEAVVREKEDGAGRDDIGLVVDDRGVFWMTEVRSTEVELEPEGLLGAGVLTGVLVLVGVGFMFGDALACSCEPVGLKVEVTAD